MGSIRKEREVRIDLRGTDGLPTREAVGDLGVAQGAKQDQGCREEMFHKLNNDSNLINKEYSRS